VDVPPVILTNTFQETVTASHAQQVRNLTLMVSHAGVVKRYAQDLGRSTLRIDSLVFHATTIK
jgi:hypothetical protein